MITVKLTWEGRYSSMTFNMCNTYNNRMYRTASSPPKLPHAASLYSCHSLILDNQWSVSHHYSSVLSIMPYKWSHAMWCLFESGFFHSTCLWDTSKLLGVPVVCSFLLLTNTPRYESTTVHSTHVLKWVWTVSSFWLLWIELLINICVHVLDEHKFSPSVGKNTQGEC